MNSTLHDLLAKHRAHFAEVVTGTHQPSKTILLDFSDKNGDLGSVDISNTGAFCTWVDKQRRGKIGWGGYLENREFYRRSRHFDGQNEPRSVHLGIDLWSAAGTAVFCPWQGFIHSFKNNAVFGDYGPTIIVGHELEGLAFFTLYGHLCKTSLEGLQRGNPVEKGALLGQLGKPEENGGWPPHLHFQVISEMGDLKGDFPGVAAPANVTKYRSICPDPQLILNCV